MHDTPGVRLMSEPRRRGGLTAKNRWARMESGRFPDPPTQEGWQREEGQGAAEGAKSRQRGKEASVSFPVHISSCMVVVFSALLVAHLDIVIF
jgi:hypothetical protein